MEAVLVVSFASMITQTYSVVKDKSSALSMGKHFSVRCCTSQPLPLHNMLRSKLPRGHQRGCLTMDSWMNESLSLFWIFGVNGRRRGRHYRAA